jgi:hypothetical protein
VDAFARYAELATAQLTALGEDDLEAFARLGAERDELAAAIDAGPELGALVEVERSDGVDTLLAHARTALGRSAEASQAIEKRLHTLRAETLAAIHAVEGRQPALRQYLETDGATAGGLDLRL